MSDSPANRVEAAMDAVYGRGEDAWAQAERNDRISDLEQNAWAQEKRNILRANSQLPPLRKLYPGEERETPGQQAKYHFKPVFVNPKHPSRSGQTPNAGGMDAEQRAVYEQTMKQKNEYQQMLAMGQENYTKRAVIENWTTKPRTLPQITFSDVDSPEHDAYTDLKFDTSKCSESTDGDQYEVPSHKEPVVRKQSKFFPLMSKSESSFPTIGRGQIEKPSPLSLMSGGAAASIRPPQAVLSTGSMIPSSTGASAASGVVRIEPGNRVVSQQALIVPEVVRTPVDHPDSHADLYTPSLYTTDVWANDPRVGTSLPAFSPMLAPDVESNKRDAATQTMSILEASAAGILPSPDFSVMKSFIKEIFDEKTKNQDEKMKGWISMLGSRIDNANEEMEERVDQMVARSTAFEQSMLERFDTLHASIITHQQTTNKALQTRQKQADMTDTQQRFSAERSAIMQPLTDIQARITRLEQPHFGRGTQRQGEAMVGRLAMRPATTPEQPRLGQTYQQQSDAMVGQHAMRPTTTPEQLPFGQRYQRQENGMTHQPIMRPSSALERPRRGQEHQQQDDMMMGQQEMRPSSAPEHKVFRTSMGRPSMTTDKGSPIAPRARLSARDSSAHDILTNPRGAGAGSGGMDSTQGFSIVTNMEPPAPVQRVAVAPPDAASRIASAIPGVEAVTTAQQLNEDGEPAQLVFKMEGGEQYVLPNMLRDAFSLD